MIAMQNYDFLGSIGLKFSNNKNKAALQDNLSKITKYLDEDDIFALKLTCRPFYYHFVTADLWTNLKLNIAQEKLQYFDDFDFEQKETKQITKKDKNIRIHSLKKQIQTNNIKKQRQPSNTKAKAKIINENNELLFRNTQIGFKRLLKPATRKKIIDVDYDLKETVQLPKIQDPAQYLIKINDPWSINMNKAQKIVMLFKKINEFHHRFQTQLKLPAKEMHDLIKKLKKSQQFCSNYGQTATKQPYSTIISSVEGAKQNLLIDEHLNKVCRLFWNYHAPMLNMQSQFKLVRQAFEKDKQSFALLAKQKSKYSLNFLESLNTIDESIESYIRLCQKSPEVCKVIAPQVISIYANLIQEIETTSIIFQDTSKEFKLQEITWNVITTNPFFIQTLFQIQLSIVTKLIKLNQSLCSEDLTLSFVINRLKTLKFVSQSLLNITRYFGKIKKQLQQKQKKGKQDKMVQNIKKFISNYEKQKDLLYLTKNTGKLEQILTDFKQKIAKLKDLIKTS